MSRNSSDPVPQTTDNNQENQNVTSHVIAGEGGASFIKWHMGQRDLKKCHELSGWPLLIPGFAKNFS